MGFLAVSGQLNDVPASGAPGVGSLGYVCQFEWQCLAGHACGGASTPMTLCPAGRYSLAGANVCSGCSPGQYGASLGMTLPNCTGPCRQVVCARWGGGREREGEEDANVHELRLGFSNTTRNPEGTLSHNNRKM